ncbi:hypothetical protein EDD15DRAFT_2201925 [Pisolithus albus]|nr:hypothetical protein EDD15DRAFT_2201925 [Pisolithus albus]
MTKEGELEALEVTHSGLVQQLATSRRPAQRDSQETAGERLKVVQNQLLQTEEKIVAMNQKPSTTDAKWEARVKEYEARLNAAEEKYKPGKLTEEMLPYGSLERQKDVAQKRNAQLENSVAETDLLPYGKPDNRASARPKTASFSAYGSAVVRHAVVRSFVTR